MKSLQGKYEDLCEIGVEWKDSNIYKHIDDWVPIAERLAVENGGVLPCRKWLIDNGYKKLYEALYRCPEKFYHIKHTNIKKTGIYKHIDGWVPIAERLSAENGGVIPRCKWLKDNGYEALYSALLAHPEKFQHIGRDGVCLKRNVDEWVEIAGRLAAENGGALPSRRWLKKNSYGELYSALLAHPEKFQHIKKAGTIQKTIDEWVKIAERLAAENGGALPRHKWLIDNKYSTLSTKLCRYPEKFQHIKKAGTIQKTIDEWVKIAERLAAENGGVLPCRKWLKKNGYTSLGQAMYMSPENFQGIEQNRLLKRPKDWVPIAERLAAENGGVLPSRKWLKDNGYEALYSALLAHPEKFQHIKMQMLVRKIDDWVPIAERLAVENGGVLPRCFWLRNNGYNALSWMIYKYPERFSHIRFKSSRRGIKQKVA